MVWRSQISQKHKRLLSAYAWHYYWWQVSVWHVSLLSKPSQIVSEKASRSTIVSASLMLKTRRIFHYSGKIPRPRATHYYSPLLPCAIICLVSPQSSHPYIYCHCATASDYTMPRRYRHPKTTHCHSPIAIWTNRQTHKSWQACRLLQIWRG